MSLDLEGQTMKRRLLLQALLGSGLAGFQPGWRIAQAANSGKPYRIYMILYRGETDVEKGFRDYLAARKLNMELIVRDVAQDVSKVPALVAEARAMRADLVYTWGTPVTLAAAGTESEHAPPRYLNDIPIVFTMVTSPEAAGLLHDRTSSGRNITGASHVVPLEQQLEAMRAYRPLNKLGVLYNPAEPNSVLIVRQLRAAAAKSRFQLLEQAVSLDTNGQPQVAALPDLVASLAAKGPQLLYLGPDSFIGANCRVITETALEHGLPCFSATEIALRQGRALFGLVSRYDAVGRLAARMAEQILVHHQRPQDIPVETLARFSYIVNMEVAARLDYYPPLKVLNYAEII
jgi:putative ABC transport system substrate-binding protein